MVACSIAKAVVWEVDAGQRLVHRRAARGAAARDLRAGHGPGRSSSFFYRLQETPRCLTRSILTQRTDAIATVVLNRPEKLNALTRAMWQDARRRRSTRLSADDELRCIIVRGAGEKAFSPGNDIGEFATERANKAQAIDYGARDARDRARARALPPSAGGADPRHLRRRRARDRGAVRPAHLRRRRAASARRSRTSGLVMAYPEMAPLVRLAGPAVALEILLEGRIFDAAEAKDKGLVTRVVAGRRGRARGARNARSASPKARRWSRAGTRSSRAAWPTRARSPRPSTTNASTASTPRTSASATRRSSPSASRSSPDDEHATPPAPVRSPACACSSSRRSWRAPRAGMMLADMGADVVKVEKLPGGDDSRGYREPRVNGVSAPFLMLNRNKRGIALNLKHAAGPRDPAADGPRRRRADRELPARHAGEARPRLRRARAARTRRSSTARSPGYGRDGPVRPTRAAST